MTVAIEGSIMGALSLMPQKLFYRFSAIVVGIMKSPAFQMNTKN
jgi:hypothetical protein